MGITKLEQEELERYKKQIDEDFKVFQNNKRLIQLEKSCIANLSHKVMACKGGFTHIERAELRKQLMKHLRKKYKTSSDTRNWMSKNELRRIKQRIKSKANNCKEVKKK